MMHHKREPSLYIMTCQPDVLQSAKVRSALHIVKELRNGRSVYADTCQHNPPILVAQLSFGYCWVCCWACHQEHVRQQQSVGGCCAACVC